MADKDRRWKKDRRGNRAQRPPAPEPVTPGRSERTDSAIDQAIPPPDDGERHSELGLVSGGAGEEGNARHHQDVNCG